MLYLGCDVHKNYTTVSFVDENGNTRETRSFFNNIDELKHLLSLFPEEEFSAVLEAGLNWGVIYDMLDSLSEVKSVSLAHPPKVKAIASARIKTDKIDSKILGQLLKADLIPEVWVPSKEVRILKDTVRFRAFVVKIKTMIKNRIHDILRKSHINPPEVKDIFGKYGRMWLEEIELSDKRADKLLRYHLQLKDTFEDMEKGVKKWINKEMRTNENLKLVKTIPGIRDVFGPIIILEIDDINRFPDPPHLHSYSGLVPSTHSSGNTYYHGKLIKGNRWLRWAFIEGAHTSVRVSPYFREHYDRIKRKAGSQAASIASARKLATIVYKVLKERRPYIEEYKINNNKGRLPSVRPSGGITSRSFQE
jgi:transposase